MAQVILLSDCVLDPYEPMSGRPIGSYVLAEKLRKAGFSTVVLEFFTQHPNIESYLESHITSETLFIGIASTFLSVMPQDPENREAFIKEHSSGYLWFEEIENLESYLNSIRRILAAKRSRAKLVIGGAKALYFLQDKRKRHLFDLHVVGKAESFVAELVAYIQRDEPVPTNVYEGALFTHEDLFNISTSFVEELHWTENNAMKGESLPIEVAKGCMYNCKFCHYEKQNSIRVDVTKLKNQLVQNYERHGTTLYSFMDDCFNDTRGKVEEVCNMLFGLNFKIEWVSYARVDVACKFPYTLDMMIESGARGLYWGLESFNLKVARSIGKGTDTGLVKEMLLRVRDQYSDKMISMGSFIIGLPGETEESLDETLRWILDTKSLSLVRCHALGLRPYSERLDKAVIDYADFSRNPEKYGFDMVTFEPKYDWRHATMDRSRAIKIRKKWLTEMRKNNVSNSFIGVIFQYPFIRSLGYSFNEIRNLIETAPWGSDAHREFLERQRRFISDYHKASEKTAGSL